MLVNGAFCSFKPTGVLSYSICCSETYYVPTWYIDTKQYTIVFGVPVSSTCTFPPSDSIHLCTKCTVRTAIVIVILVHVHVLYNWKIWQVLKFGESVF